MYNIFDPLNMPYTLLNVPYKDKDKAKQYGARWNPNEKSWYCNHRTVSRRGEQAEENYFYLIFQWGTDSQKIKYKDEIKQWVHDNKYSPVNEKEIYKKN